MNKKITSQIAIGIILLVAVAVGRAVWVKDKKNQIPIQQGVTTQSISTSATEEQPQSSSSKNENIINGVDCGNPQNQMESTFCAGQDSEKADRRLEYIINKVSKVNKAVLSSQKYWQLYRDQYCKAVGDIYEGGSMRDSVVSSCSADITNERAKDLESLYRDDFQSK